MIYAEVKSPEEQRLLDDALEASKRKSWYRRLQIIALSAKKSKEYTVQKLSEMFNVCQQTVRNYIHAYNNGGLDKLAPGKSTGRPPKIAHWTREQLDKVLEQTPTNTRS